MVTGVWARGQNVVLISLESHCGGVERSSSTSSAALQKGVPSRKMMGEIAASAQEEAGNGAVLFNWANNEPTERHCCQLGAIYLIKVWKGMEAKSQDGDRGQRRSPVAAGGAGEGLGTDPLERSSGTGCT